MCLLFCMKFSNLNLYSAKYSRSPVPSTRLKKKLALMVTCQIKQKEHHHSFP